MIIEEEVYLEHYGVAGMKWGKRKGSSRKLTKKQQAQRKKKIENGAKLAGYLLASGLLLASIMPAGASPEAKVARSNAKIQDFIVKNGRTVIDIPAGALDLYRG